MAGISLMELIIVIILISILTVTAGAKFFSSSGFEEISSRSELIIKLRAVQLKSMQQSSSACIEVVFSNNSMLIPNKDACTIDRGYTLNWQPGNRDFIIDGSHDVEIVTSGFTSLRFDHLGRALAYNALVQPIAVCNNGCSITLEAEGDDLDISISAQGYVYASN